MQEVFVNTSNCAAVRSHQPRAERERPSCPGRTGADYVFKTSTWCTWRLSRRVLSASRHSRHMWRAARHVPCQIVTARIQGCTLSSVFFYFAHILYTKKKLHGLSPRANYTDRATTACREVIANFCGKKVATWSVWRIPTAVFSAFRQEPLLFYQVTPQLYSRGWVDPVPDPPLFFFC
jgi:hypothetical protein